MEWQTKKFGTEELAVLSRVLQFTGNPDSLRQALPTLTLLAVPAGAPIIREGEVGTDVYVLVKGDASVRRKRWLFFDREIARLRAGDFFGEIAFLVPTVRSASVVAMGPCEVFRVVSDDLKSFLERNPALREKLEETARERLFALARQS